MTPLYPALISPPLWMGIPRIAVVLIWGIAFLAYVKQHSLWCAIVGLIFHITVAACIQSDKQFFEVMLKHCNDQDHYHA